MTTRFRDDNVQQAANGLIPGVSAETVRKAIELKVQSTRRNTDGSVVVVPNQPNTKISYRVVFEAPNHYIEQVWR